MRISQWSESILIKSFSFDPRAGLPEVGGGTLPFPHVEAGVPAHLRGQLYQGLRKSSFPYGRWDQSNGRLVARDVQFVALESDRFRVIVCPEFGGRIFSIYDQKHHADMLWNQPTIHQEVFGLAGAWFVGGVEFNANRFGHLVLGHTILRTGVIGAVDKPEGLSITGVDEAFGCSWEALIRLGEESVSIDIRFTNHAMRPAPAYWWTNIAVPAHAEIRLMMQPGPVLYHGVFRPGFDSGRWPMVEGVDWSRWMNQHEINSLYFHERSEGFMGYIHEAKELAFVHHADSAICKGRKLWTLGIGPDQAAWLDRLSEPGLPSYYEMQCGLAPTQLQAGAILPGQTLQWTESFGFVPFQTEAGEAYQTTWQRFREAAGTLVAGPKDLSNRPRLTLFEPANRQVLSEQITFRAASLSDHDVEVASRRGWLAGDAWIARLRKLAQPTDCTSLALVAALLDKGELADAKAIVEGRKFQDKEPDGWAVLLIGRDMAGRGMNNDAVALLRHAASQLPHRVEAWSELIQLLLRLGDDGEAAQWMRQIPQGVAQSDAGRILQARVALACGDWMVVQQLTDAPLDSIAEAEVDAWMLRRESLVAQALQMACNGEINQALSLLIQAGRNMAQFGTGAAVANNNGDLLYYRWAMAHRAGQKWTATSTSHALLARRLYPASDDALYAARLAKQTGHPSYTSRRQEIEFWNRQDPDGMALLPLRQAMLQAMDGDSSGWLSLRSHPVYRHRAAAESSGLFS